MRVHTIPCRCIICTAVRTLTPFAAHRIRVLSIGAVNVLDATPAAAPASSTKKLLLAARSGATSDEYVGAAAILYAQQHHNPPNQLLEVYSVLLFCVIKLVRSGTEMMRLVLMHQHKAR